MYVRVCMRCLRVSEFIFVFECMFVCQYAHLHVQQCICMNVLYVNIKYSSTRISTHCATQRPPLTSISRMFRLSGPYRTSLSVLASFPPPPLSSHPPSQSTSHVLRPYRDAFPVGPFVGQQHGISHGSLDISRAEPSARPPSPRFPERRPP